MPRVLIVSYPWLPAFTGGVRHVATLCRYLPEAGWDPIVLTRDWTEGGLPEDAALGPVLEPESEAPPLRAARAVPVALAPYARRENRALRWHSATLPHAEGERPWGGRGIARALLAATYPFYGDYPDQFRGWVEPAVRAGIAAIRQYGIGAVVSVSAPDSAHVAGGAIARAADIPWVPLFGDMGTFHAGEGDGRTTLQRMAHRALVRRWMRGARRGAAVSPGISAHLRADLGLAIEPVAIPFDPDERRVPPRRIPGAPLRLVHVGRTGADDGAIEVLLDALDRLITTEPATASALRVELVGTGQEESIAAMLPGRPAATVCEVMPRVSPERAIVLQREADLLLLLDRITPDARGAARRYPATLPEHLNARRPTLAIATPGGYVDQVLTETRAGEVTDRPEEVVEALRRALAALASSGEVPFRGDEMAIARHGGPEQARRLVALLDASSAERFGSWQRS